MGEDKGQAFIAMEYIEGRSLEAWLADKRRWSVEETVRFIIEVAEALESTHKKNIVHRDIKPGNILVDAEGHPHLVDFGIARIPASTLTQTTAVLGTPFYMAPEQVAARKIDHRVDIFALGAIFYEMLTLEKPFTGENLTTIIYKIMNEEPIPLRQFKGNLPPALDPIVRKVLAKDPDARYQSCRALINDLIRFAEQTGFDTGRRPLPETSLTETKKLRRPAEAVRADGGGQALAQAAAHRRHGHGRRRRHRRRHPAADPRQRRASRRQDGRPRASPVRSRREPRMRRPSRNRKTARVARPKPRPRNSPPSRRRRMRAIRPPRPGRSSRPPRLRLRPQPRP